MLPVKVRRVLLAEHRVDFRKGLDGLLAEAYRIGAQPYEGDCVVYVKKDRTQIRALVGDGLGLYLVSRRFEGGACACCSGSPINRARGRSQRESCHSCWRERASRCTSGRSHGAPQPARISRPSTCSRTRRSWLCGLASSATSRLVSFVSHFVPPKYVGADETGVQEHHAHAFSGAWQVNGETSESRSSEVRIPSWKPRLSSLSNG
jgi:hypothetical protein